MQPTLPFEIWIAHIDILALDAWGVPALALGPIVEHFLMLKGQLF